MKKGIGVLLLVLGAVGVLFCLAAIYETGTGKDRLLCWTGRAFDSTGEILTKTSERLDRAALALSDTRVRLKSVASRTTDALETDGTCDQARMARISRILDEQVRKRLDQARALVNSTGTGAISHFLALVDALSLVPEETHANAGSLTARIEGASVTLTGLSPLLEQTLQTAHDLSDGSCSGQSLAKLTHELGRMDGALTNVQTLLPDLNEAIQKIKTRFLLFEEKAVWWIKLGSVMIPLMLLWLGAGQFFLMYFGWRIISGGRAT